MTYTDLIQTGDFGAALAELSGPSLVTLYNEMALTAHDLGDSERPAVKRFASATAGRSRVEALHLHILGLRKKATPTLDYIRERGGEFHVPAHDASEPDTAAGEQEPAATEGEAPASDESDNMAKKAKAAKKAPAKKAPAKKAGGATKRSEGPSLADYTKEWNDLIPAAKRAGVTGVKVHTSPFETKVKAQARIDWLNSAIKKASK